MVSSDWFLGGPNLAFARAGGLGPDEEMGGWAPWERGPRGPWGAWGRWPKGPKGPRGFGPWGAPGAFGGPFGPGRGPLPFSWRMGRRFPFGPGMGPGPGGFGPGGPRGRMFGRGDLKYALLDLLKERPKHGYEMIKDLEERSGGFYTPSAGAIYPTLQLLEDREWVRAEPVDGKKVYAMTDAGRQALAEHEQRHADRREEHRRHHEERHSDRGPFRGRPGFGSGRHGFGPFGWQISPELMDLGRESMEVAQLLRAAVMASGSDAERLGRLRAIVARTKGELNEFLGQSRQSESGQPGPGAEPASGPTGPVEQI